MKTIIVGCKWRHEELGKQLLASSKFHGQVIFTDEVKDVDFVIPEAAVGIYVICNNDEENMNARRKVVLMRRHNDQIIGVVIVRRIPNDTKNFLRLQKLATIDFGFNILIVTTVEQAAKFVHALATARRAEVVCEATTPTAGDLIKPLQALPKMGPVRAKKLLQRFGSISAVCTASVEELAEVVGEKAAQEVKDFMSSDNRSSSDKPGTSWQM
uniref:Fanconi anemia core complex-associated protein 24 pseudonuclease domain-containing protein n=1 Tax=Trichuris muris TaxID=70415 RepID=A0A5S6Q5H9_TRIMR